MISNGYRYYDDDDDDDDNYEKDLIFRNHFGDSNFDDDDDNIDNDSINWYDYDTLWVFFLDDYETGQQLKYFNIK